MKHPLIAIGLWLAAAAPLPALAGPDVSVRVNLGWPAAVYYREAWHPAPVYVYHDHHYPTHDHHYPVVVYRDYEPRHHHHRHHHRGHGYDDRHHHRGRRH